MIREARFRRQSRRSCGASMVVLQSDKYGFSWFVRVQGKARPAVNGRSPLQDRNAAMDADRPSLLARPCMINQRFF